MKRQRVEDLAVLHTSCCGIDVHQKSISACVLAADRSGKLTSEVRQFATTKHELLALTDWLAEHAVTHVAMESTSPEFLAVPCSSTSAKARSLLASQALGQILGVIFQVLPRCHQILARDQLAHIRDIFVAQPCGQEIQHRL